MGKRIARLRDCYRRYKAMNSAEKHVAAVHRRAVAARCVGTGRAARTWAPRPECKALRAELLKAARDHGKTIEAARKCLPKRVRRAVKRRAKQ